MLFALHVPNHTLSPEVTIAATLAAVVLAAIAWKKSTAMPSRSLGLFAVVVGLIFAVQLLNFPLVGGTTSGHLIGTAAAVVLLGPLAGAAASALVIIAQCLLLGDGGTTALGANLLNMTVAASLISTLTMSVARSRLGGAFLAGWLSTVVAAIACAVELAASGVGTAAQLLTLVGQHALLGIVEGAFTVVVVLAATSSIETNRKVRLMPIAAAAMLALALSPLASSLPDTLEILLGY